jgi:hypothetical protein
MPCNCQGNQPAAEPGACDSPDAAGLFIAGLVIGGLGALFMANLTGETSVRGIYRKTKHGVGHTYSSAKRTVGSK